MTRHDEDGDLAGTTPADNLGEHAAVVAWLRKPTIDMLGTAPKKAADVIEKLSAELATEVHAREQWFEVEFPYWQEERDKISARLALAEDFIEQAPHVATCGAVWKARAEWPDCTCWKADYKKAASDE